MYNNSKEEEERWFHKWYLNGIQYSKTKFKKPTKDELEFIIATDYHPDDFNGGIAPKKLGYCLLHCSNLQLEKLRVENNYNFHRLFGYLYHPDKTFFEEGSGMNSPNIMTNQKNDRYSMVRLRLAQIENEHNAIVEESKKRGRVYTTDTGNYGRTVEQL